MLLVTAVAFLFTITVVGVAFAGDSDLKSQLEKMQKQFEQMQQQMQQQIDALKTQLNKQQVEVVKTPQAEPAAKKAEEKWVGYSFGDPLHVRVAGFEVSMYGLADLSYDYVNNGLKNQTGAVGKMGWMSEISSNNTYFGIRGAHPLWGENLSGIFQIEEEVAYSYTPGPSPQTGDPQIKSGVGARNSFIGFASPWGLLKIGKTDAPYKTSTAKMDPFDRTLGDYNAIMGNTGGDNRAEFDTRLPHAIWYESPNLSGFKLGLLFSPGQNRSDDNSLEARGEPNCQGGNPPGPDGCHDGSYGDAYSASLSYTSGPLYLVAASELHSRVNRLDDEGQVGNNNVVTGVHDEWAAKAGVQYYLDLTGTTFNVIYEKTARPGAVSAFDERTRDVALYVAATQKITNSDLFNIAWAHAGKSPGSPWWTNANGSVNSGTVDNSANMYSIGVKHIFDKYVNVYLEATEMLNARGAHYDLGASGHGIYVDDHDGAAPDSMENTFSGTHLKAISLGMQVKF